MKTVISAALLLFLCLYGLCQPPTAVNLRSRLLPQYAPFYHGVASGDPQPDRVMIWTRITPSNPGVQTVNWMVSTDTGFVNIIRSGVAITNMGLDYTIKVDVDSLQPATWYFYRFDQSGRYSLIGRTRTTPTGNTDSLRVAVVSCSNYPVGYFNAYGALSERNDVHAIVHLGDYLYEGGGPGGDDDFTVQPDHEILTFEDYRLRHSNYKLDEDLRRLHQMYPFISVWDDHETANDSWRYGAEGHDSASEGNWEDRLRVGVAAYKEWQPIRLPNPADSLRIYRNIKFGNLCDLYMLDTRIIARDSQVGLFSPLLSDTTRQLLGVQQMQWLADEVDSSNSQWKIVGQQVMVAPLLIASNPFNVDQWDGYVGKENRFYDLFQSRGIQNLVVLTGDIHSAWANDLPLPDYVSATGDSSAGVEFVGTSVTSNGPNLPLPISLIQTFNEHIKYANTQKHGYFILDINHERVQADFFYVNSISTPNAYTDSREESWKTLDGDGHLTQESSGAIAPSTVNYITPPLLPANPVSRTRGFQNAPNGIIAGSYPNPFSDDFYTSFSLFQPGNCELKLLDISGKTVWNKKFTGLGTDLQFTHVEPGNIPSGLYILKLEMGKDSVSWRVVKVN